MEKEIYSTSWSCPSNIALVKYWGKHGRQLPNNPSVSFTLDYCRTETSVSLVQRTREEAFVELFFEGKPNKLFSDRIENHLNNLKTELPWVNDYRFVITTQNSFPHSSGIASSASAFGALGLCLAELNSQIVGKAVDFEWNFASRLARLGSGSAARSLFDGFAVWGHNSFVDGFSNDFAQQLPQVHPIFNKLHDSIAIVHAGVKEVSSSAGHSLMDNHPFAAARYEQAQKHVAALITCLKDGNWSTFSQIVEKEALTLHALMMTSGQPFVLLKPASLAIIEQIQRFRSQTNMPITYTIDAGPNIHILYPYEHSEAIQGFIESDLKKNVDIAHVIHDKAGKGPYKLT